MERSVFDLLEARRSNRCVLWSDPDSGLRAILVLDDLTLGPAAGGVRTRPYPSLEAAVEDATALARAMTLKCALGGVDAGGGKVVVIERPAMDRQAAFMRLGQLIEELRGIYHSAGDLGTTSEDLAAMARYSQYVHTDKEGLGEATARGVLRCIEACVEVAGKSGVAGLRVAIQGCGAIGSAVAHVLASAGAELIVADRDPGRVDNLAAQIPVRVSDIDSILIEDCDVVCPCAVGGVLTTTVASSMRAWAVCGAANNIVAVPAAERTLLDRGILLVPDIVSSAGAVIQGIGRTVMRLTEADVLIDGLGQTARAILIESGRTDRLATEIARERALAYIHSRRTPPREIAPESD